MLRGWRGIALCIAVALAVFAGVVLRAVHHAPKPQGWSGLEFSSLSPAAAARTPMLAQGGAQVFDVAAESPAAKAKIAEGEVVAAIDGAPVASARQASDIVRDHKEGDRVRFTLFDVTNGEVKPHEVTLSFEALPPEKKKFSVHPPRTLAKEVFNPLSVAANAAWSRRIFRGPTIRPLAISGLGDGKCNGFAPEEWKVAGHAKDNSMFHVMANEGFAHAVFQSATLTGSVDDYLKAYLQQTFGSPTVLTPPQEQDYGFVVRNFGNQRGGAGFVLYRVTGKRIVLWLAAVPGGDVSWAKPLVGAVALSMRCAAPGAPASQPRDKSLLATRVSLRCLRGECMEGDFAGSAYLPTLRFGYVHNDKGDMFLVRPRRDYWENGAQGPGFYHQIGGENERLYPGRIN